MTRNDDREETRREFCVRACKLGSLAAFGTILSSCGGGNPAAPGGAGAGSSLPVVSATRANGLVSLTVDSASPLAAVGGVALVQSSGANFLVARTAQDTFTALTAICTHQVCGITGFSGSIYICPCHGSEFDTTGRVVRGPANAPLRQYATQFSNNVLTISA